MKSPTQPVFRRTVPSMPAATRMDTASTRPAIPSHRQLHIIVAKKPAVDGADRRFRSATYRTSYGLMNQWLGPTPASPLPGHAAEMAQEGGFRSLYSVVPFQPADRPATRKEELSDREKLLYGISSKPNTRDNFGDPSVLSSRQTHMPPLNDDRGSTRYQGSRRSNKSRITGGTGVSSGHNRLRQDLYGDPTMAPAHLQFLSPSPGGYEDHQKSYPHSPSELPDLDQNWPTQDLPRLRNGRHGGSWRHVKEVMQAKGDRTVFVDGMPRVDDTGRLLRGSFSPPPHYNEPHTFPQHRTAVEAIRKCKPSLLTAYAPGVAGKATEGINWLVMR